MPFTMPVSIAIILGPDDAPSSPPPKSHGFGDILLITEVPAAPVRAFTLAEVTYDGKQLWQAALSPAQSQTLADMLAQIPDESLSAPPRSFDGVAYDVHVARGGTSVTFTWSNEDWRYADDAPKESWEAVAALAEYVKGLESERRT